MGTLNIARMSSGRASPAEYPILRVVDSKDQPTTAASSNTALPTGTGPWVRLLSTVNTYVKLGDAGTTAAAGDFLLAANIPEYMPIDNLTHIAAKDQ